MRRIEEIIVDLGLLPDEVCGDWDRTKAVVKDSYGKEIGYVDTNDGKEITIRFNNKVKLTYT